MFSLTLSPPHVSKQRRIEPVRGPYKWGTMLSSHRTGLVCQHLQYNNAHSDTCHRPPSLLHTPLYVLQINLILAKVEKCPVKWNVWDVVENDFGAFNVRLPTSNVIYFPFFSILPSKSLLQFLKSGIQEVTSACCCVLDTNNSAFFCNLFLLVT